MATPWTGSPPGEGTGLGAEKDRSLRSTWPLSAHLLSPRLVTTSGHRGGDGAGSPEQSQQHWKCGAVFSTAATAAGQPACLQSTSVRSEAPPGFLSGQSSWPRASPTTGADRAPAGGDTVHVHGDHTEGVPGPATGHVCTRGRMDDVSPMVRPTGPSGSARLGDSDVHFSKMKL